MIWNIAGWVFTALLGVTLPALLIRYFSPWGVERAPFISDKYVSRERTKTSAASVILTVLILFAASRAVLFGVAAVSGALSNDPSRLNIYSWIRWDANHYITLAENWYVNEGDPRFHIVFFPLYPAVLRLGKLLFGWDARAFGIVFSNVCLIASCCALYRLAEDEYGHKRAVVASALFMFSPVTFFYSLPFSESLFFLLAVSGAYMAKRKKFAWAIALGALASATRLLGLLSAVVVFYEFIRGKTGLKPKNYIKYALAASLVALGFLAYLWLNYAVTGSCFTFLRYQKEHWSQSLGNVGNTVKYTLENALSYSDQNLRFGTWIPQTAAIMFVIILLCASFRRVSASDGAYCILYIWFALSPTWLLSGARYVSAMFPLYFMISGLAAGKKRGIAAVALSAAGLCYMFAMYLSGSVM